MFSHTSTVRVVPRSSSPNLSVQGGRSNHDSSLHIGVTPVSSSRASKSAGSQRHVGHLVRCCGSEPILQEAPRESPTKVEKPARQNEWLVCRSAGNQDLSANNSRATTPKAKARREPHAVHTVDAPLDSRTPSESSTKRAPKRELASLCRDDVTHLLKTLSAEQREHFQKQAFYDQCRHKFHALDMNKSGFLESGELQKAVVEMFPGKQRALIEEYFQISAPRDTSIESIIAAFDQDADGRISEQEFPEFVKFCQAWRIRMYFTTPIVEKRPLGSSSSQRSTTAPNCDIPLPGTIPVEGELASARSTSRTKPSETTPDLEADSALRRLGNAAVDDVIPPSPNPDARLKDNTDLSPKVTALERSEEKKMSLPEIFLATETLAQDGEFSSDLRTARSDVSEQCSEHTCASSCSGDGSKTEPLTMLAEDTSHDWSKARTTTSLLPVAKSKRKHKKRVTNKHMWTPIGEQVQLEAFSALASTRTADGKTYSDLVSELFRHVLAKDGTAVLPEEALQDIVEAELEKTFGADEKPSDGWQKFAMAADDSVTMFLLTVIERVADQAGTTSRDLVAQILWRCRNTVHHRNSPRGSHAHANATEDISWVSSAEILEKVRGVFALFTADAGEAGHMHCREWLKIVHLLLKDPVLRDRIQHQDVDRLFYASSHKDQSHNVITISCDEFFHLLIALADSSRVHPHECMLAIGCHEDEIRNEIANKGGLKGEYIKQFYR